MELSAAIHICVSMTGQDHPDAFKHIADEYQQIRASKTHAKLMDPTDLPRRQQGLRRIDEGFWRQSTSNYAEPIAGKKRRKQTLGKAPRKAARIAKPGRQAACCLPQASLLHACAGPAL